MKLSHYIVALKRLAKSMPGEDPEIVIRRYSDYTTEISLEGDEDREYPKIIELASVPGAAGAWLRRVYPDEARPNEDVIKKYIELARGN